jgi:hypothetical protein
MQAVPVPSVPSAGAAQGWLMTIFYIIVGLIAGYGVYKMVMKFVDSTTSTSGNLASGTPLDGKTPYTVTGSAPILSAPQGQYGIQFWAFIKDWDYNDGQEKPVLSRSDTSGNYNPQILLHPTDNQLMVRVHYLPADSSDHDGHFEVFECDVPNVPLQSWFSVSVSLDNKNLDTYINGKLVRSCLVPGVPINVTSNALVGEKGGFSGQLIDMHFYNKALTPLDASSFYNNGNSAPGGNASPDNPIGRYNFKFAIVDKATDQDIKEFSF